MPILFAPIRYIPVSVSPVKANPGAATVPSAINNALPSEIPASHPEPIFKAVEVIFPRVFSDSVRFPIFIPLTVVATLAVVAGAKAANSRPLNVFPAVAVVKLGVSLTTSPEKPEDPKETDKPSTPSTKEGVDPLVTEIMSVEGVALGVNVA